MDNHFQNFIANIDENISGIIWLTQGPIKSQSPYFSELNYLFDGLIAHSLKEFENTKSAVFFTLNFDKRIFLIHADSVNGFDDVIKNLHQLLKDQTKKLVIIHSTPVLEKMLSKEYPQLQFKTFE